MKRNLCYRHHTAEFDKLPDAMRHLAADWRTVEVCEACEAQAALMRAALAALLNNRGGHSVTAGTPDNVPVMLAVTAGEIKFARAALAGTRSEEE